MGSKNGALAILLIAGSVGCGDRAPAPVVPVVTPSPPPRNLSLLGTISNTALAPLPGVRVEVVGGSQTGLTAITNASGHFEFSAPFSDASVTLRATKEGYATSVDVVANQANRPSVPAGEVTGIYDVTTITMSSLVPPVNIAGDYTVGFVADLSCDLSKDLRERTYSAVIASQPETRSFPANTHFVATVSGAQFLQGYDTFDLFVAGNDLNISVSSHDAGLVEEIGPTSYLALNGDAAPSVDPGFRSITAPLRGSFLRCEGAINGRFICPPAMQRSFCSSQNHQLILRRR